MLMSISVTARASQAPRSTSGGRKAVLALEMLYLVILVVLVMPLRP
jgi:hypothetical protein